MPSMTRSPMLAAVLAAALSAPAQDPVRSWNDAALDAIRAGNTAPPAAARNLAILHTAVFDAVNGIRPRYSPYAVAPDAPRSVSPEAAAIAAAHAVLVALYPARAATFDALREAGLDELPDKQRRAQGAAWGEHVAQQILADRSNDGSTAVASYPGSLDVGMWRPTVSFGGVVRPALLPAWGAVRPFAIPSGSWFRPPLPPALPSAEYAAEILQVQSLGRSSGSTRTAEETEIALFWGYGPGTATPPGHWNQVAIAALGNGKHDLVDLARTFALLNVALADAAISSWDCKYEVGLWRPITAIQLADQDGNPWTEPDAAWTPLLPTPPFPEYTSGHSTFSGAAAVALAAAFGRDKVAFAVGSDDLPGVVRWYESFSQAAIESGSSRIFGGIHFWSGNVQGLEAGARIGDWVVRHVMRPLHGK